MNKLNCFFLYFNHGLTKNTIISYSNERFLIVMQEITLRWLIKYFTSQTKSLPLGHTFKQPFSPFKRTPQRLLFTLFIFS